MRLSANKKKNVVAPLNSQIGVITFIQRFGTALNLHVHYHTLVMDALFYRDEQGRVGYTPIDGLSVEDSVEICEAVRRRVLVLFKRSGLIPPEEVEDMFTWKNSGFSVNADVSIEKSNRHGLRRLIRYCARPAFADKQLSIEKNDMIKLELSKPSAKGETELLLRPYEFLNKLVQILPKPRRHRHIYHRALAPNSRYRKSIVAYAGLELPDKLDEPDAPSPIEGFEQEVKVKVRYFWAILLARVYELMPLKCSKCGGEMKIIAFVTECSQKTKILNHLELPVEAPPLAPARGPPQEYDQVDMEFEETFDQEPDYEIDQRVSW